MLLLYCCCKGRGLAWYSQFAQTMFWEGENKMEKILKLDTILFSQSTIFLLHQDSKKNPKDMLFYSLFPFPPWKFTFLVWEPSSLVNYCYICNGSYHCSYHTKLFTLMYLLHFFAATSKKCIWYIHGARRFRLIFPLFAITFYIPKIAA